MSGIPQANSVKHLSCSPSSVLADLVDGLTARLQAGEAIDWEAVLRDHPDHADELRRLRHALAVLDELASASAAAWSFVVLATVKQSARLSSSARGFRAFAISGGVSEVR
jgi:hypothetical protein